MQHNNIKEKDIKVFQNQNHFTNFKGFIPTATNAFGVEFERLASSQGWKKGSEEFNLQHTVALRAEFDYHYFSQAQESPAESPSASVKQEPLFTRTTQKMDKMTEDDKLLRGYQRLCREVRKPRGGSIEECCTVLKSRPYVNIVDLIDSRCTGSSLTFFDDFNEFMRYTLRTPGKRVNQEFAIADVFLSGLLQNFRRGPGFAPVLQENGSRTNGVKRRREDDLGRRATKAVKTEV
jgi:hypothetical protein